MKKDGSSKQRLTSLDIPMTRPANLFDMDLSNALDSFQPGNIEKEDMPNVLPIFNRQTDKFEKLMKKKRPSSMPVYPSTALRSASVPALHKELPQLPTKIGSADNLATNPRSVSMYLNSHSLKSCDDDFITPLAQTFNKPKHIIVDDDTDSLFSDNFSNYLTNASTVSNQKPNDNYNYDDFLQNYLSSEESMTHQADNEIPAPVADFEVDHPRGSSDDLYSFVDSLFGSDNSSEEYNTPYISPEFKDKSHFSPPQNTNKSKSSASLVLPDWSQTLPKTRGRNDNHSMASKTKSMYSTASAGNVSLHDAKQEVKEIVRQRPFSFCLDSGKDYENSRYYIPKSNNLHPYNNHSKRSFTSLPKVPEAKYELKSDPPVNKQAANLFLKLNETPYPVSSKRYSSLPVPPKPVQLQPQSKPVQLQPQSKPVQLQPQSKPVQLQSQSKPVQHKPTSTAPPTPSKDIKFSKSHHTKHSSISDDYDKQEQVIRKVSDFFKNHAVRHKRVVSEKSLPDPPNTDRQNRFIRH